MSELAFVASAISAIINTPVKTYDECVASSKDVILPAQVLDLESFHRISLVGYVNYNVEYPTLTHVIPTSSKANLLTYEEIEEPTNTLRLNSQPIQIFVKTLIGKSQGLFVDPQSTVAGLKRIIQAELGFDIKLMRLLFSSKQLDDYKTLEYYNIQQGDTIHILFRIFGGFEFYVIDKNLINPKYDYDFTGLKDDGTTFIRGKELYKRPYGWKRIALNVKKYGSDNKWLGSNNSSEEWPVSFHGTKKDAFNSIAEKGYLLDKGLRFAHGLGIYSTPNVEIAEEYAAKFKYTDGKSYKVAFQNRVNPVELKKVDTRHGPYWITPDEKNIRPYGLCFKNID